ncbi:anterior gradient protein 3 [Trichechus manatus latirostris]|uniref:Anterior gradient protein 3 n=1 Tax=Trichechus manatus latirostris TaxID=127582 RepID=A0A2Y9R3M6_TRIMA|nr:anterior gradient protein 3 [Trichechus manatus latirostris]
MMLHSALALSLLFITVSFQLAIKIKREKKSPQTLSRGIVILFSKLSHLDSLKLTGIMFSSTALKKVFAQNEEIQEMAQNNFIMLNLMHETNDKNLSPDGQYVPRIMFVDPSLTVRADITGKYSNRLYTYEPQDLPVCKYSQISLNSGSS